MDVTGEERGRLGRLASWLEATPAELAGLIVLVAGAAVAGLALWAAATQRPDTLPESSAAIGQLVESPDDTGPAATSQDGGPGAASAGPRTVTVHVTGAVTTPGLVTLPAGSRVGDAVAAAGGTAWDADPERLNLARLVEDGEHVHLPRQGEVPIAPNDGDVSAGGVDPQGRIDINRASEQELQELPGIGPAKAAAIVAHREEHGPFGEPGDLRAVSGIGERTFQQLAELIVAR